MGLSRDKRDMVEFLASGRILRVPDPIRVSEMLGSEAEEESS